MFSLCQKLNRPVKPSNIAESLITHLILLGILTDTPTMMLNISEQHKQDLISSLKLLLYHCKCTKHELLSLIGKLSLTCKVMPSGRIFLCWLIDPSCSVLLLHHYIRLTKEAHLDIFWLQFLPRGAIYAASFKLYGLQHQQWAST